MGDSITEGQYVDPSLRWTSVLEGRLTKSLGAGSTELLVLNRGISGETTRQGLERFPAAVQEAVPDVVMIQFGMNDCNCWQSDRGLPRVSEQAFTANLREMIERCHRFDVRETILATNPCTLRRAALDSGEIYEHANARYSELVREVASAAGVTLCDIRSSFEELSDDELTPMLQPAPDLLHLTPEGHRFYADVCQALVERAVARVMPRPDARAA